MEKFVKITNISHRGSGPIGAWIANNFLEAGTFVTVSISKLPENWQMLGSIFSFEFLDDNLPTSNSSALQPLFDKKDLKEILKEIMDEQQPSVTKKDLVDLIKELQINPKMDFIKSESKVDAFIPKIEGVEEIQISMEESKSKISLKDLKEKLRKNKENLG